MLKGNNKQVKKWGDIPVNFTGISSGTSGDNFKYYFKKV